jgi:dihydrofolate reductase
MKRCSAKQFSDQMVCGKCALTWDVNDPEPPVCVAVEPQVIMIAAMDSNNIIGRNNGLPWHSKEDLKHFQRTTSNHVVIMGRKTFMSIGGKALPDRYNIVVTRQTAPFNDITIGTVRFCSNKESALDEARAKARSLECDVFIIGGGEVYAQFLDSADKLILSKFPLDLILSPGDVVFPPIGEGWIRSSVQNLKCSTLPFTVETYVRT